MTSAAILDSVLRGNTGKMAKDKEKRAVWTEQEEDMLMDLYEDNKACTRRGKKPIPTGNPNTPFYLGSATSFRERLVSICIIARQHGVR